MTSVCAGVTGYCDDIHDWHTNQNLQNQHRSIFVMRSRNTSSEVAIIILSPNCIDEIMEVLDSYPIITAHFFFNSTLDLEIMSTIYSLYAKDTSDRPIVFTIHYPKGLSITRGNSTQYAANINKSLIWRNNDGNISIEYKSAISDELYATGDYENESIYNIICSVEENQYIIPAVFTDAMIPTEDNKINLNNNISIILPYTKRVLDNRLTSYGYNDIMNDSGLLNSAYSANSYISNCASYTQLMYAMQRNERLAPMYRWIP